MPKGSSRLASQNGQAKGDMNKLGQETTSPWDFGHIGHTPLFRQDLMSRYTQCISSVLVSKTSIYREEEINRRFITVLAKK
jgi:hypothetical protein